MEVLYYMLRRLQFVFQFEVSSVPKQISAAIFVLYQASKLLNLESGKSTRISCAFEIGSESVQLGHNSVR